MSFLNKAAGLNTTAAAGTAGVAGSPSARSSGIAASSLKTGLGSKLGGVSAAEKASPLGGKLGSGANAGVIISAAEFGQLRDFIYGKSGIYIADNRKYLLENRLANRLKQLGLKSFSEYFQFLQFDARRQQEMTELFNAVTTNETSFYRNPPQLKVFQEKVLKAVLDAQRAKNSKTLRIWSAGCSTGEEPYTLTMILAEVLGAELPSWNIRITANDLSENVLKSARAGMYGEYALRTTPKEIVSKYFLPKNENDRYAVKPELKKLVTFGSINLSDRTQLKRVEKSHIVFCRNVIIYFDEDMKKQVISSFYDNLLPGGFLLIGHSESLHNITRAFKPVHHPGAIVYQKEG